MNKNSLFAALQSEVEKNLRLATDAAKNTYDMATNAEFKAENKYDTRSLEASYLAGAQAERVADLRDTFLLVTNFKIKSFTDDDKIEVGAVIELVSQKKSTWTIILPTGGGQNFEFENRRINVITPNSPLGRAAIGKYVGDSVVINGREFEIVSIF